MEYMIVLRMEVNLSQYSQYKVILSLAFLPPCDLIALDGQTER